MTLLDKTLSYLGLMRVSVHEEVVADNDEKAYTAWAKMANERDDLKLYRDDWQAKHNSLLGKFKKAVTDLAALDVTEWSSHIGDPPGGDSPLLCVYDAGIGYAFDRLAEWIGVTDYEMGDGSEDYATDVGRTGANVLVAAGFVNEDGDLLGAADMAALKADALAMRKKREDDRDRIQAKRDAAKGAGK